MRESNVPKRLWDYGIKHAAMIGHFISKQRLEGMTPWEAVTGNTPDVSEYLDFTSMTLFGITHTRTQA